MSDGGPRQTGGQRRPPLGKSPKSEAPHRMPGRAILLWLGLFILTFALYNYWTAKRNVIQEISYSQFQQEVEKGNIRAVKFVEKEISGMFATPVDIMVKDHMVKATRFKTYLPTEDPDLVKILLGKGVHIEAQPASINTWWNIILNLLPWVGIAILWFIILRQMQAGPRNLFSFGKSKARLLSEDKQRVTFNDVAGADEAKQELREIIEFLKEPKKFQRMGAKIPKGALLLGPPGTGKTLLARAVAGEAGVPFFSMSGSDFVEMFVGVGASRVRDLFEQGKQNAPCIIFIDEIDAVGRHRGAGLGGGHDEREQTLNQLLVEMDGFATNEGVIILAATNRPDVLDPALLRPGRFDRIIVVDRPDVLGREGIFKVHLKKVPISQDVDVKVLARGTPGFSGADIANMVNEAALLAARRNHDKVLMEDLEESKDKVMMGAERKSLIITEEEKKLTAFHEAGHTLVSKLIPNMDPIHKVTIIPRGRALGLTQALPIDEKHNYSKTYCENQLAFMLGGRAAEKLVFNELSTGAGNDIERATALARKMVCEWGMSDALGPLTFGKKDEEIFLGREFGMHRDFSEATSEVIDREIRTIVEKAHERAETLLKENVDKLHALAHALLERECLDGEEVDRLMRGEALPPKVHPEPEKVEAKPEGKPATQVAPLPQIKPAPQGT